MFNFTSFDRVITDESALHGQFYDCLDPLVDGLVAGASGAAFSFGAPGSGKSSVFGLCSGTFDQVSTDGQEATVPRCGQPFEL